MRLRLLLLLAASGAVSCGASGLPPCADADVWIPAEGVVRMLTELAGDEGVSIPERSSPAGRALARTWLRQELEGLGLEVTEHDYGSGSNVVGVLPGRDPERVVVLGAHYDAVPGSPGADDNGSGTVGMVAVASALSACEPSVTLKLVAFDEEELGLLGSSAYVDHLTETGRIEDVEVMINLDMIGYDSDRDGEFMAVDCDRGDSPAYNRRLVDVIERDGIPLTHVTDCNDFSGNSDQKAFWDAGRPALFVSEKSLTFSGWDGNPCYHQACDAIDLIDFRYLTDIASAVARLIAEL